MPKKFQGQNTKAVQAKARKAAIVNETKDRKEREAEDAKWVDDDKHAARKLARKQAAEKKRLEALNKKKELNELLESEEKSLVGSKGTGGKSQKVTRAQIDEQREKEEERKRQEEHAAALLKKNISIQNDTVEENINQVLAEAEELDGSVQARSIDEAISILSVKNNEDRHPERRMKSSYKKFEEEYLPQLKADNPSMRISQLRKILRKEWQKSPENPMNQHHLNYNSK